MDEHPAQKLFQRGLCITINTDDPKMFGNSLADEYRLLEQRLGFSRQDLRTLILNGISASWMPAGRKAEIAAAFCANPDWQDDLMEALMRIEDLNWMDVEEISQAG